MPDEKQLALLHEGVDGWNEWRGKHPRAIVDLAGADLCGADLTCAVLDDAQLAAANLNESNLSGASLTNADLRSASLQEADLTQADLQEADLREAKLAGADLTEAHLVGANLGGGDLSGATLVSANLGGANLGRACLRGSNLRYACLNWADLIATDLREADLRYAELRAAQLVFADLSHATIQDCWVHGVSAWDLKLEGVTQTDLIITPPGDPQVTVDDIEVAQFVYLLLNNKKIRNVIHTIGRKGVLILGRFTPERKVVLDGLRELLRKSNYVPIVFDFEGAQNKDFSETVKILAGMSRFIVADITKPKSSPLELQAIVPDYMVPLVPIIQEDEDPFSMFANLQNKYDWVLDVLEYKNAEQLLAVVDKAIIQPALAIEIELLSRKTADIRKRHADDYH